MTLAAVWMFIKGFAIDAWFKLGVSFLLPMLVGWVLLRAKAYFDSGHASNTMIVLGNAALAAVSATQQEYTDKIKEGNADGVLTDDEKRMAFNMAANKFKTMIFNQLGEAATKKITDGETKTLVEGALKLLKARL